MNKLYDNCFTTELNTVVMHVKEEDGQFWHACKDTIFYKESGGMASDIGVINDQLVLDLKYEEGHLWHLTQHRMDGSVFMSVNLHERFRKCQVHTAQHLISAVLGNVYKVKTLAHHVGDEENDIEFDFKEFTDKMLFELQVLCNGLIRDDLEVSVLYPSRKEAEKLIPREQLHHDELRVIRIGALDYNLCGCMHVPSLRYIQMIYITGYEKTTHGYKVKYICGDQFLDCVTKRYKVLDEASQSLAVSHLYVNTGVNRLLNETRQLNRDVIAWKQKYYDMFGKELCLSKEQHILHFFDDIDIKSLAQMAQFITSNYDKIVIFVAKIYDNVHVVVASSKHIDFDCEVAFKDLMDNFRLKGGGSKELSQGGGIYQKDIFPYIENKYKA